jgi:aminoglycoside 6'-N-acetyltransferase
MADEVNSPDRPGLRGPRALLRPLREADLPVVEALIAEPAVVRWWGAHAERRLRRDLLEDELTESFAIELEGQLIGVLLVSEENTPDYRHAALDISLATAHHGRGLGREALRTMIDHLVDERGHHRFTIDPNVDNAVAIRCYSAVGFKPVGVMRRYERGSDGNWGDGLLMDLLADERL